MDSCVSAKQQSSEDEGRASGKNNPLPHFSISPFYFPTFNFAHATPFLRQPSTSNRTFPLLAGTSNIVRQVQSSVVSSFESYIEILDELTSRNGVLDKLKSVASNIQNGCKVQRRKLQNIAMVPSSNFAAIIPGDSMAGVVVTNGFLNFLSIYNSLLVARLVLTWFPSAPQVIVSPLSSICDPYLNIFRGIIPPLGGTLDLSPILAFLVLNALTSTASALPAELPAAGATNEPPSPTMASHLTAARKKWMRRLSGSKSKPSHGEL